MSSRSSADTFVPACILLLCLTMFVSFYALETYATNPERYQQSYEEGRDAYRRRMRYDDFPHQDERELKRNTPHNGWLRGYMDAAAEDKAVNKEKP